jgi:hypothetical protein
VTALLTLQVFHLGSSQRLLQLGERQTGCCLLDCPALRAKSLDQEADERVLGVSAVAAMDPFYGGRTVAKKKAAKKAAKKTAKKKKK